MKLEEIFVEFWCKVFSCWRLNSWAIYEMRDGDGSSAYSGYFSGMELLFALGISIEKFEALSNLPFISEGPPASESKLEHMLMARYSQRMNKLRIDRRSI